MVGDGQQSVYPGGFSLSHLGIDVRGRSSLLKVNYRNTRAILEAARGVVGSTPSTTARTRSTVEMSGEEVTVVRDGTEPSFVGPSQTSTTTTPSWSRPSRRSARIPTWPGRHRGPGPDQRHGEAYASLIQSLGLRPRSSSSTKVSRTSRSRWAPSSAGRGWSSSTSSCHGSMPTGLHEAPRNGEDETAHAERLELLRRQVFVAMTRARDGLWGGWVGTQRHHLRE
jgi:hypothetical protein